MDLRVVEVTKTYFVLSDGRRYDMPFELDSVPSLKEFNTIYDKWKHLLEINNEKSDD